MESIERIRSLSRRIEMREEESEVKRQQRGRTMRVGAEFGDPSFDVSLVFLAFLHFQLDHLDIVLSSRRETEKHTIVRFRA